MNVKTTEEQPYTFAQRPFASVSLLSVEQYFAVMCRWVSLACGADCGDPGLSQFLTPRCDSLPYSVHILHLIPAEFALLSSGKISLSQASETLDSVLLHRNVCVETDSSQ
jgi:hypothetical protein